MKQESKYRAVLLDRDGCDISERPAENLKQAGELMRYMLSDQYAEAAKTTHEKMGTHKVEVRNASEECVLDDFYASKRR